MVNERSDRALRNGVISVISADPPTRMSLGVSGRSTGCRHERAGSGRVDAGGAGRLRPVPAPPVEARAPGRAGVDRRGVRAVGPQAAGVRGLDPADRVRSGRGLGRRRAHQAHARHQPRLGLRDLCEHSAGRRRCAASGGLLPGGSPSVGHGRGSGGHPLPAGPGQRLRPGPGCCRREHLRREPVGHRGAAGRRSSGPPANAVRGRSGGGADGAHVTPSGPRRRNRAADRHRHRHRRSAHP